MNLQNIPAPPSQAVSISSTYSAFDEVLRRAAVSRSNQSVGRGNANKGKTSVLEAKKNLPNVHAGLHYFEVAQEYGGLNMVFTFLGEDKHK
jgi:hypothetical protein